jgi:hypothetical protein
MSQVLIWDPGPKPELSEQIVHVTTAIDAEKFHKMFIGPMMRPAPGKERPTEIPVRGCTSGKAIVRPHAHLNVELFVAPLQVDRR